MSSVEYLPAYSQAKFTPKGVNWIAGLWAVEQLGGAA